MNARVYEQITERIIALLAQGTVPWHKPWKARTGLPRNLVSQKHYRGINVFLLLAMNYESPFWLTFRQALQLGGAVRKGEKSCPVVFWKQATLEDKETHEPQKIPLLRYYHVFNVAQCDGLKIASEPVETFVNTFVKPDEIVAHMPQRPVIKYGMARAFYSPREDYVGLPVKERFEQAEGYYATLFHELVHATGHASRLNRATLTDQAGFGSNPYCKEELIAEMGAAFLCGHAEVAERTIDNSAAYLNGSERLAGATAAGQNADCPGRRAGPESGGLHPGQWPRRFSGQCREENHAPATCGRGGERMKAIDGVGERQGGTVTEKPSHTLKIEAVGDFAARSIKPRIRISGHWLERAGFKPGHRVIIHALQPGEMTLQFLESAGVPH